MQKGLEGNIWKYGLFLVLHKRVYAAILGAYYLTIPDVTVQTIGVIFLLGKLGGTLFEIPSGYLSDKLGHKNALVFTKVLATISTLLFLLATNVFMKLFFLSFGLKSPGVYLLKSWV